MNEETEIPNLLAEKDEEIQRLRLELEETNRGVVALYAELDEKAESLRRADELKSKFLSNMSHEFRTPLNAITGLSRLLLDNLTGELNPEQQKQVNFILKAAQDLMDLVNDLLDIAKIEAGKTVVRPVEFSVTELFTALRGMFRPLQTNSAVKLVFEIPAPDVFMFSDEAKVSQILRNYISNALKFTESGSVTVSAVLKTNQVTFSVADTGIGIPEDQLKNLFHEFTQLENPLQRKAKGTGLGLALTRKLSELLGGTVQVTSVSGKGSEFVSVLPQVMPGVEPVSGRFAVAEMVSPVAGRKKVLIIDDEEVARYLLRSQFGSFDVEIIEADKGEKGLDLAKDEKPDIIFLDLNMPEMDGFQVLHQLKEDPATRSIPVIVNSSKVLETSEQEFLSKHAETVLSKEQMGTKEMLTRIKSLLEV